MRVEEEPWGCTLSAGQKRAVPGHVAAHTRDVNLYDGPQCNADAILALLAPWQASVMATDTLLLGLVDCDLYSRRADWNFLWGWAPHFGRKAGSAVEPQAARKLGLVSFARGGGSAADPWARQPGICHLLKHHVRTAAHLGLQMRQCTLARCLFNGVGCDEEMAAVPWSPCPCCLRKLVVSGAVNSARELFSGLAAFCQKYNDLARARQAALPFENDLVVLRERLRAL